MSLHLVIPDPLAQALEARAAATGQPVEAVALAAIEREFSQAPNMEELLKPVRQAFNESGMTEDESFDFLEVEKHDMRQDRKAAH